jgi:hypothetical protein
MQRVQQGPIQIEERGAKVHALCKHQRPGPDKSETRGAGGFQARGPGSDADYGVAAAAVVSPGAPASPF